MIVFGSKTVMSANMPGSQQSTIADPHTLRGERRHFPDREFERDHRILAHIAAEYPRESAEAARMTALSPFSR